MRTRNDSRSASGESNRHSSTDVACSENRAKFTPRPSQVAPSGYGRPGQTRTRPAFPTAPSASSIAIVFLVGAALGEPGRSIDSGLLASSRFQPPEGEVEKRREEKRLPRVCLPPGLG